MKLDPNAESASSKNRVSYREAGVDRVLADRLVDRIRAITGGKARASAGGKAQAARAKKLRKQLRSSVGGYASLYEISKTQWLAASTDGVGTKLKLAFETGHHDTVGIDLVAMSVNDLLCVGARPLFFLDYFATGKLDLETSTAVIEGIQAGCDRAGLLLVGGETAEMPGMYMNGEYDLAGFAVGILHPKKVLPRAKGSRKVRAGQTLVGFRSSGFHSNGFSLIRRIVNTWTPAQTNLPWASSRDELLTELLIPTELYTEAVLPAIEKDLFSGLAHLTGSGFLNVPRMGENVSYEIELPSSEKLPRVYEWLERTGAVTTEERLTTFNCGIGMIGAVDATNVKRVIAIAKKAGIEAWAIGKVIPKKKGSACEVVVHADGATYRLKE